MLIVMKVPEVPLKLCARGKTLPISPYYLPLLALPPLHLPPYQPTVHLLGVVAVIADLAMAPYASAVYSANYGNGVYGNDASLPLLTSMSGAFCGDMVFANRQVGCPALWGSKIKGCELASAHSFEKHSCN